MQVRVGCAVIGLVGAIGGVSAADVAIDGVLGENEWDGSVVVAEGAGQSIRVIRDGDRVYIGGESNVGAILTVYVCEGDRVRVLHASYAVGEGGYEREDGGGFVRTGDFDGWARPADAAEHAVRLDAQGWSASTIEQGERGHMEFVLDAGGLEGGARIAVSLAVEPEFEGPLVVPEGMADGTALGDVQRGPLPERVEFETGRWVALSEIGIERKGEE